MTGDKVKIKGSYAFCSGNPVFDATVTIIASGSQPGVAISNLHAALLALYEKEPHRVEAAQEELVSGMTEEELKEALKGK